jgi:hypothetical protein
LFDCGKTASIALVRQVKLKCAFLQLYLDIGHMFRFRANGRGRWSRSHHLSGMAARIRVQLLAILHAVTVIASRFIYHLPQSGHSVQTEAPDVVITAILDMILDLRD